jgi:hypothetical protein
LFTGINYLSVNKKEQLLTIFFNQLRSRLCEQMTFLVYRMTGEQLDCAVIFLFWDGRYLILDIIKQKKQA